LTAAVTVRIAVSQTSGEGICAAGATAGVLLMILGIAIGWHRAVYWAVAVVAGFYVASTMLAGAPDAWAISVATALLLSSELAGWSIDSRRRGRDDLAVHGARLRTVVLFLVIAFALAFVVQDAAALASGGVVSAGAAMAALIGTVTVVCMLAWRFGRGSSAQNPASSDSNRVAH
jgi:hypothetical protein